ncbi:E1 ubiquitin-activating protein uba2 [Chamberlinius hualienensis]
MAAELGLFSPTLCERINNAKLLVVGAGGVGCELIKNLVLTGFKNIDIIDLDTIDISNLNRQFLFHKQHVGKSKAKVAQESALKINPDVKIIAYHDSITNPKYGLDYFKSFDVVLNALDNRAARNHVNRMCLAAETPLIESGSAGYIGQATVIKKGLTECYECEPKAPQKTYPGCTIRNTPSEPIHCIVWAKHLFNQLFGEADPDEDVSPDTADPEAVGEAGSLALNKESNTEGNVVRVSTRSWAVSCGYNHKKLFTKLFHDDIKYLLSMDRLWEKRRRPTPLDINDLPDAVAGSSRSLEDNLIRDQRLWSLKECEEVLQRSVNILKKRLEDLEKNKDEMQFLVWDKDDDPSMDFVTACANIRAGVFGISQKSRFDVKSMAGNIIPAIATTNAVIGGLVLMETLKVLEGRYEDCRTAYLNKRPVGRNLIRPTYLNKPNPKCTVCSSRPEIGLKVNIHSFTVGELDAKVLKSHLNMVAPDVTVDDGKGTILISSEEGETEENNPKSLNEFGLLNGTSLICDDFLQSYQLLVRLIDCEDSSMPEGFELVGDVEEMKATINANNSTEIPDAPNEVHKDKSNNDNLVTMDEDDIVEVSQTETISSPLNKRISDEIESPSKKRMRLS